MGLACQGFWKLDREWSVPALPGDIPTVAMQRANHCCN
jgi:hypothetical protein